GRGVEIEAIDYVAPVGGQGPAVLRFGLRRARLGELPSEPAEFDHRAAGAIGQHYRHLQQHLEHVADVVRVELGKTLGAIPALQQKGLSRRDRRQALLQAPGLAGNDEWGETPKSLLDIGERGCVAITGY